MTRLHDAALLWLLPLMMAGGEPVALAPDAGLSWGSLLLAVPVVLAWAWIRGGRP
jgi:hypothetical protein